MRAGLAAVSGQGKKKGKKGKMDKAQDEATTDQQGEEDTNAVESRSINSYYTSIIEKDHDAILNDLGEFENEIVNDSSSRKISSDCVSKRIEKDASDELLNLKQASR